MSNQSDFINVDDIVDVEFERCQKIFGAKVVYLPYSEGDSWHLRLSDGSICYVQSFAVMTRRPS